MQIHGMNLSTNISFLKGIGDKRATLFYEAGLKTFRDVLYFIPRKYLSHDHALPISHLKTDDYVTIIGEVMSCGMQFGRKKRFVISVTDRTGICKGVWFNYISSIEKKVKKGQRVSLTGKVAYYSGYQLVHPEIEILDSEITFDRQNFLLPIYTISDKLRKINVTSSRIREIVSAVFNRISENEFSETLPPFILQQFGFPSMFKAFKLIHQPESEDEFKQGLARFKFEELFHLQLFLLLKKRYYHSNDAGNRFEKVGDHFNALYESLPFELTNAQKRVVKEIRRDMKQPISMNRLVQGDVGSGKTIVALLCLTIAVDNGYQTALMAPTEILAEQHYLNILKIVNDAKLKVTLLTGSLTKKKKEGRLADIANGMVDIVVGTHAIIQDKVSFKNLGFIIIDEQHRFGVMQRAELVSKGHAPDVLVMTATPIPRTLALTVYGDLDVSIINELPKGRKNIITEWKYDNKEQEIYGFLQKRLRAGEQAYIVYPLVEESEKMDLKAATDAFSSLSENELKGFRAGLLHGKMKAAEKEETMRLFKEHQLDVLISTTVIEVGVDVPNATIMIIENAERFGLTQLHQLRGRVGRGDKQSFCILKTAFNISSDGKERMNVMVETNDGFRIAEEDLRLRGIGEIFGTRQSGVSDLRMANLMTDQEWLILAREEAEKLLAEDPHLRKPEHEELKKVVLGSFQEKFGLIEIA